MANNGLPPGATLVSGTLPPPPADAAVSPSSAEMKLPPGATLVSGTPPSSNPTPIASSTVDAVGNFAKGIIPGAVEGMAETLQHLPFVGKHIISPEDMEIERAYFAPGSPAEKAGQTTGEGAEAVMEFVLGDAALKGLAISQKIGLANKILEISQKSPYIAKLLEHGAAAARMGTVTTAEALAKGATPRQAIIAGGVGGVGGEALNVAAESIAGLRSGIKFRNPFRKVTQEIMEGKAVAQAPAEAAIRGGVTAGATEPATAAGVQTAPILQGSKTILDEPLNDLFAKKSAAYKTIDDTVGFDLKEAKAQLRTDQYNLKQMSPADVEGKAAAQKEIDAAATRVKVAEAKLSAKGIDPKAGDVLNTKWEAGRAIKTRIVSATNPDGTINVDKLLNQSKLLRFTKWGDRLEQFMGKAAADQYMLDLEAAQKAGVHAVKVQKLAKYIGGLVAGGTVVGAGVGLGSHAVSLLAGE